MIKEVEVKDYNNEQLVRQMLFAIGENPNREGLNDTPKRIVKMWKEIYRGYDKSKLPKVTTFNNGSDGVVYDEMLCDTGSFYSQCEHHGVPFFGRYYFGVIYHPKGKILGLSKVARVVDYFSAKLQVQERLGQEIINYLWESLKNKNTQPIGMGLILEGTHLCKQMRGVKKEGVARTTILKGTLKTSPEARAEFLGWVNKNGR